MHHTSLHVLFATNFISHRLKVKSSFIFVACHRIPVMMHTSSPNQMSCEPNVLVQWSPRNIKEVDIEDSALMKIPLSQIFPIFLFIVITSMLPFNWQRKTFSWTTVAMVKKNWPWQEFCLSGIRVRAGVLTRQLWLTTDLTSPPRFLPDTEPSSSAGEHCSGSLWTRLLDTWRRNAKTETEVYVR